MKKQGQQSAAPFPSADVQQMGDMEGGT
jgi:hypothetical protein